MSDDVQKHLEEIGAALRDARVEQMLTQTEVGEQAGVSRQLVSRIEQGCNGEISAYFAVAAALGHRFAVVAEPDFTANVSTGLDFATA